ncbi:MAG: MASE1 domain-containing protein [Actinomycetales bacterium]|nr:MASE1 domain-containing protein [Actinomycetales bacterium]
MYQRSMTAAIRRSPPVTRRLALAALLVLIFVLSAGFAALRLPGSEVAPWWPAAAVCVAATVAARGRRLAIAGLILLVSALANLVIGTDPALSAIFALANAAEAWIVARIIGERGDSAALGPLAIGRLLIGVGAGAASAGIIAAVGVILVRQESGLEVFTSVAASHASAVLLLGSFALVPWSSYRPRPVGELLVQAAGVVIAVIYVFLPGNALPLAFLPFPILAWGAFRFPTGVVAIETLFTVTAATAFSLTGGGPFASFALERPDTFIELLQVFSLSLAVSMLMLSAMQNERQALIARLSARQRLLRGGIVNAHAGFLLAEQRDRTHFVVLESNPVADELFAPWIRHVRGARELDLSAGPLAEAVASLDPTGWAGEVEFPGGVAAEVSVAPVGSTEGPRVLVIQAVDVTERRRIENALTSAFENERASAIRLRELNRQKDDFVSSVSHELRTPITSLIGYAEELEASEPTPEQREALQVMVRNAHRLAALVEDLLVVSRTGEAPASRAETLDAVSVLLEAIREIGPLARSRGIEIAWEGPDELETLAEPESLTRMAVNLLGNAVKFSRPDSTVTVRARAEGATVRIEVRDEGDGIAPEDLDRVFERFYRSPAATAAAIPGTGLGLPIVRTLAQRLGGTVHLESDGRRGTTAILELPAPGRRGLNPAGTAIPPAGGPATD